MIYLKKFNENNNSQKWAIFAGLSGGFGGANFIEVYDGTEQEAERYAYQKAIEEYDSYEGLHGLRTSDQIMEDDGVSEEEAESIYNDERENWLEYYIKPYNSKIHN